MISKSSRSRKHLCCFLILSLSCRCQKERRNLKPSSFLKNKTPEKEAFHLWTKPSAPQGLSPSRRPWIKSCIFLHVQTPFGESIIANDKLKVRFYSIASFIVNLSPTLRRIMENYFPSG